MKIEPVTAALLAAGVLAGGSARALGLPAGSQERAAAADCRRAHSRPAHGVAARSHAAPVPMPARQRARLPRHRASRTARPWSASRCPACTASARSTACRKARGRPVLQVLPRPARRPAARPRERRGAVRGQGSGFIVSADGLILTNAHVVRDAKEVTVKLSDRREFAAKVLGSDAVTDVAVLRIDATNLPTVRLGDARQLEVGDPVLAIGAPYGLEQTATQGIVSAKGRSLPGDAVVPFIQTDAAVNPGNSGGPLFDGSGAVVGINAQIYSQSGGFQGLSFAIPIDVALKVKDQIVATGKASHARLGVSVQDLNQALAESFGLKKPDGALVAQRRARQRRRRGGPEARRRDHRGQRRAGRCARVHCRA